MKLVTLARGQTGSPGVVLSDGTYLDLGTAERVVGEADADVADLSGTVMGILAAEQLQDVRRLVGLVEDGSGEMRAALKAAGGLIDAADAQLKAPIPQPSLILAHGMAYREHLEEMGVPIPDEPTWFIKASSSVVGSGAPIVLPRDHGEMVDWEGEFSIVIGRPCYRVEPDEAMDHVAGYTIINDVSARDWVASALSPGQPPIDVILAWGNNLAGKQYPSFTPMGPVLVTADEITDCHDLQLTTTVNGEVMQDANTSDLIFRIDELISHLSQWHALQPGDVISTGSPSGVGYARDPKIFLKHGDLVEVTVSGVGTLSNPVMKV